ncbi:Stk1 family PASTA domain-containing Ser/Thr kinase [Paeniglutamicibacter gangotriensis]|uniref:non-specific serine/threonine protein kinase n=1 Tax=Paeniglutamicibacter gangotriensis Lz1y TaxID=1276920 RepID=M7MP42_9MICC|nr:Stk1 family PASTA domain-containing Ser/Thr kinase [Paeniglutamicibacter gangotriensis]EMQ98132.1 serine/threonine protein kinase with PASTA sensor(s) [Paeniglutamicibacter gangotriensis Lz1y]
MTAPHTDPRIGTTLDARYRLDARIADGGMSTVYRAMDVRLHRTVAVKILHAHMASDPAVLERFEAEAIISAGLTHDNIVGIRDHHVSGSTAYLVMEYVRGLNLSQSLKSRGRYTPRQALVVLQAICTGLSVAHEAGIVHRDMKPANVLISDEGRIKVADFGLARAASAHTNATNFFGTAAYISPELAKGDPSDERSDIYAVGIIAYELLTGRQPFTAESAYGLAFKHINDDVPAPSAIVPGLSSELDELVAYCTNKDPEDRPQNASFLLSDLKQIHDSLPPAQLDLGSEILGGLRDLIPPATSAHTTVHEALAQAQEYRDSAAARSDGAEDATRALGGPGPEAADEDPSQEVTRALGAGGEHTTVLPGGDHTQVFDGSQSAATAGASHTQALSVPPHQHAQAPTSARQAKKQAKAAELAWRKDAQIPTHELAPRTPTRRKWLLGVGLVLLAALIAAVSLFFGMGPGANIQIPLLTGSTASQAVGKLGDAGVQADTREVFDGKIERGLVVGSEPAAGETIRRFQGLTLLVSKGPELFAVPNLSGRKLAEAQADLKTANLAAGKTSTKHSEELAKGVVLSQDPGSGEKLRRGSKVSLVVSLGPAPVEVPSLAAMSAKQADAALKKVGLKGKNAGKEYSSTVPSGQVSSQKPASGQLERGSTVEYVVSRGPKMIEVPSVQGRQLAEARKELEALGFKVEVEEFLGGFFGTVRSQSPDGGSAEEGSTIKLVVV